MMSKISFVVLILCNTILTVRLESCPEVKVVKNLDVKKVVGKWYEIQRYPNPFQANMKCNTAEYTLKSDGTIDVFYGSLHNKTNEKLSLKGKATPSASDPARMEVQYQNVPQKLHYFILDTDYKNFALVYDCFKPPGAPTRVELSWILSRTKTLNAKTIKKLEKKLKTIKSNVKNFEKTDQTNCG